MAPLSGVSDLPYRMLNRLFGCELAFVEMINARSAGHHSRKTRQMLAMERCDRPLGIQLLGCETKYIRSALSTLAEYKFDVLDFNAACPVKKVTRRGEGASLLKEPRKLESLLKLVVKHSRVPVTAKIRTGWDSDSLNAVEVAQRARDAGVAALFIHGRTKVQGYSGEVDYPAIKKVKDAVDIPVVASGDVLSVELAKKMFEHTGCDGLLLARGALGNPWLFEQITQYISKGSLPSRPDTAELKRTMLLHLDMCVDFYGERVGVVIYRKFFSWYTLARRKIRPLREKASRLKTKKEMLDIIALV